MTKAAVTRKGPEVPGNSPKKGPSPSEPPPGGSQLPKIPQFPPQIPGSSGIFRGDGAQALEQPRLPWCCPSSSSKPRSRLLEIPTSPSLLRARGSGERKIRMMPFPKKNPKMRGEMALSRLFLGDLHGLHGEAPQGHSDRSQHLEKL